MKKLIWISYDLGVSGDYENLYAWLDDHDAKECGESLASFWFSCEGDVFPAIEKALRAAVSLNDRSRIYVVFNDQGKVKGRFVIGGRRKRAPWEGYGTLAVHDEEEADDYAP